MRKCLGLDLGSNSLGWALVDLDTGKVSTAGVRVFPEGVARTQSGGEISKNEQRRIARGARRQTSRRKKRKRKLKRLLVSHGLLPDVVLKPRRSPERMDWEREAFQDATPYELRAMALDEKLDPFDLGRALLHLCQRRGFLSNRKADKAQRKEESGMLAEISDLQARIEEGGFRTLGEYLAAMERSDDPSDQVRGWHTRRSMYKDEFRQIWLAQAKHYPDILTEELHEQAYDAIFYQRPLRVPKSLIGTCELETNRRRCPRADRLAQQFRMLQEVNHLLLIDEHGEERPLAPEERTKLLKYLGKSDRRTFQQIKKHLGYSDAVQFNLERGERKSLYGLPTDKALAHKDIFGPRWYKRDEEDRNRIVRTLLDADEKAARKAAQDDWGLTEEQTNALLRAELPKGHASFCRQAIAKLLPHLEDGLPLMTADDRPCAITKAGYLRPDQRPVKKRDSLPAPDEVPNPIVMAALREVRKVVNAIIREYGKPDEIHIELAREVKGSAKQREQYTRRIRQRERERDKAADAIRELPQGIDVNRTNINRYLLWEEQDRTCVYSGKAISLAQLFGGEIDVDHILPKSRSLDDSLMNKVVCFRDSNRDKGNRTPYEWLAESAPDAYDAICLRARKLPYGKYRKFTLKEVVLDNFIARQLNDTAYISRKTVEYLRCLVENPHRDMLCTKGQLTSRLRYEWGLNTVLRDDGLDLKNRDDHRHHAVDAIVVALTGRKQLRQLAREDAIKQPYEGFREDVENIVNGINVSHRVSRKISGAFHKETVYGPTEQEGTFAVRKPLDALTVAEVSSIRDDTVREKVTARLAKFSITPGRKKKGSGGAAKIPPEVWAEPLWMNKAKQIPIKKVRITKDDKTIQPIRQGRSYVKPGSTHHLCVFRLPDGKCDATFTTTLEAACRVREGKPVIQRTHPDAPDAEFIMSLSPGELILADWKGQERLLQYRTSASTQGQIYLSDAKDARKASQKEKFVCTANTLKARKVTVDPLGRMRWAND